MGTKTADEAGTETGTEAQSDEKTVVVTKAGEPGETAAEEQDAARAEAEAEDREAREDDEPAAQGSSGVGQGAAAVVSAGLGIVSLTGSSSGTCPSPSGVIVVVSEMPSRACSYGSFATD
ncbi:hypothetical protein ABZS63_16075, partial [Streptomyces sp. NPDC005568]